MTTERKLQDPPNGGWLAWRQVIASFCMTMCSLGLGNSFGLFQSYYHENVLSAYSPSTIAWIGTTQGFLFDAVGLISGRLYDFGHVKPLLYCGMMFNVLGLVAASFATTYWATFLSLGVCVGLGGGLFYVPSLAIVTSYFSTRQPLATGLSATGGSIGGIVYPLLFRAITDGLGFPWTCRIFACLNGVLLLISCFLIHARPQLTAVESTGLFDRTAFRDYPFVLFAVSMLFLWLGVDIPFFYLPTFVEGHLKLPKAFGSYLLAALNASSIFGRVLLGLVAMYSNSFHVWQVSIAFSCILFLTWIVIHNLGGIIAFVIVYGFLTGGVMSLVPSALLVISPDVGVVGTRLGMGSVLAGIGFLLGPPVAGVIEEKSEGGYTGLSLFAAMTYLAALVVLVVAYWLYKRTETRELEKLERSGSISAETVVMTPELTQKPGFYESEKAIN
ncbi:Riboflavin transporter MCH5 protein [Paramyrothecium foliicola]|nr:Riboflavin transporter MCH5 protein [Paramyrothecium foliicola]